MQKSHILPDRCNHPFLDNRSMLSLLDASMPGSMGDHFQRGKASGQLAACLFKALPMDGLLAMDATIPITGRKPFDDLSTAQKLAVLCGNLAARLAAVEPTSGNWNFKEVSHA